MALFSMTLDCPYSTFDISNVGNTVVDVITASTSTGRNVRLSDPLITFYFLLCSSYALSRCLAFCPLSLWHWFSVC